MHHRSHASLVIKRIHKRVNRPISIPTKSACSCISRLFDVIRPSTFSDDSVIPLSWLIASITFNSSISPSRYDHVMFSSDILQNMQRQSWRNKKIWEKL